MNGFVTKVELLKAKLALLDNVTKHKFIKILERFIKILQKSND